MGLVFCLFEEGMGRFWQLPGCRFGEFRIWHLWALGVEGDV